MEKRTVQESDIISQLPEHITDEIMSRMPIKDMVRTSILSRKWRFKWTSVPKLVFDDQCAGTNLQKLVKIIDRVLLLHTGPIRTFMLSHTRLFAKGDIDPWIRHLSRSSIKGMALYLQKYNIPTSLFDCRDLIYLYLLRCRLDLFNSARIVSSFEGFKYLTTLYLQRVELSRDELEALISCCPLLKYLTLKNLEGITKVNVEARNLESLEIKGAFMDVTFGVTNYLKSITLDFDDIIENRQGPNANLCNLRKFFGDIHNVQILKVENYSLKYLAHGNVPLPHALVHLKYLSICIDFNKKEEISTAICLIRISPHLKKVEFQIRLKNQQTIGHGTMADFWKDHHSCCLEQVQVVSMDNISGTQPELEFMKFLLTSLPNLQTMMIRLGVGIVEGKLLRDLLRFSRASTQAKVIIL